MQGLHVMYNIDTPLKFAMSTPIDPAHNQFIESLLSNTNQFNNDNNHTNNNYNIPADAYNGFNFDIEFPYKEEEFNCNFPKKHMLFPQQRPEINYIDIPRFGYCEEEDLIYHIPINNGENTALHSNNLSSPGQVLSGSDSCSMTGSGCTKSYQSSPLNELSPLDRTKFNLVKVQGSSKKMVKKIKTMKKVKKQKRMSERLKNIAKNYGKNCAAFAISELGHPFVAEILSEEEISLFKDFIKQKIPTITNIANFREMLLPNEHDSQEIIRYKKTFQHVSTIFIRDYSTNWIFHSPRINDVKGHIYARPKMLRRIQNPKNFTYIH